MHRILPLVVLVFGLTISPVAASSFAIRPSVGWIEPDAVREADTDIRSAPSASIQLAFWPERPTQMVVGLAAARFATERHIFRAPGYEADYRDDVTLLVGSVLFERRMRLATHFALTGAVGAAVADFLEPRPTLSHNDEQPGLAAVGSAGIDLGPRAGTKLLLRVEPRLTLGSSGPPSHIVYSFGIELRGGLE